MMSTRHAGRLIDACIGLQMLVLVIASVGVPRESPWAVIGLASALLTAVGWVAYRVRGWIAGIWLILAASLLGGVVDAGVALALLSLVALAVIVLEQGWRWGIVAAAVVLGSLAVVVWLVRHSVASVIWQSIGNLIFVMLGLAGGLLLNQVRTDRRENLRLLAELRASVDTEKELMLADERSRSARELHDGLGHRLTLIAMNLEYAQRIHATDPERAWTEVAGAREESRNALAYMRRWVRALNPPREPNLAGNAAFEAIADSFRGTGLSVTVSHAGREVELGKEASLFAYRLVQEGLTNVLRHSNADRVEIALQWGDGDIEIEMRDNGGPLTQHDETGGFGLRSLAERARELGGAFATERSGDGMVLVGRVPVGQAS